MLRGSRLHQAFPASRVGGIDGVENKGNSFLPLWRFGHSKKNSGVTDLIFRPNEPLAHCCRRNQKGRSDTRGVDGKNSLQHQRSSSSRINCGMRADEKKFQPFVGKMFVRL